MSKYNLTIIIEDDEDSGYVASCPEIPGCYSQGETLDETISSMKEAIEVTIDDMVANNETIPISRNPLMTIIEIEV